MGSGKLEIWVMKEYGVKESVVKEFNIASYEPEAFEVIPGLAEISKNRKEGREIVINRVSCALRNGEILLEDEGRALLIYDPQTESFKDVELKGMPEMSFDTVVHVGNFNKIETRIDM
ncbi:hypothetical protein L484_020046 [Morus notabilis]|uniref:F-box associated domain-containing protein n=1 Tax=Morus notabilis TaxID=981085 RepID=W9SC26_9ROSA|nr:hypothetical protein L484_020046 [Morus notabilis]